MVGNLHGVKPIERVVKVLGTGVFHYQKIYRSYEVLLLLSCSCGSIVYHCINNCMFCMILFNLCIMYSYCYVCSVLGFVFHCVVLCIICV